MAGPTARSTLAGALRPMLPAKWRIYEYDTVLDKPSTTVVLLTQRELRPSPASPQGVIEVDFLVTVVSHLEASRAAEDALDDAVLGLAHAMRAGGIRWGTARKVKYGQRELLAYDIDPVTVLTQPDPRSKE